MAWRGGSQRRRHARGEQIGGPEWGDGNGKDRRTQELLQKQSRNGLMGKESRKRESQISNLGKCVSGEGFNMLETWDSGG